ncbi:MAG: hypothetical protein ACPGXL_01605 [Chitinophagales bacterium]
MEDMMVNIGIPAALWMTVIAGAMWLIFTIIQTAGNLAFNPAQTIKGLAGIILFFVVSFIIYTISPDTASPEIMAKFGSKLTPTIIKGVSTGITLSLVLIAAAAIVAVVTELINLVR